jgi:hypothetical protein
MLLLFLAIALTEAQQAKHDATEWVMYQQIQSDKEPSLIYGGQILSCSPTTADCNAATCSSIFTGR